MASLNKIKKNILNHKNDNITNEQKYIKTAEEIIKEFNFDSTDEITLSGLDSLIALTYEEDFPEIERCKIHTKLIEGNKLETYIVIHLKGITPITFCCHSMFTDPPKMSGTNMIGKLVDLE